jgi:hypothetical protein
VAILSAMEFDLPLYALCATCSQILLANSDSCIKGKLAPIVRNANRSACCCTLAATRLCV